MNERITMKFYAAIFSFLFFGFIFQANAQDAGGQPINLTTEKSANEINLSGIPFSISQDSDQDPQTARLIASKIEQLVKKSGGTTVSETSTYKYSAGIVVRTEYDPQNKYETYQVKIDQSLNGISGESLEYHLSETPGFFCISDQCIADSITTSLFKTSSILEDIRNLFERVAKDKNAYDKKVAEKAKADLAAQSKANAEIEKKNKPEAASIWKTIWQWFLIVLVALMGGVALYYFTGFNCPKCGQKHHTSDAVSSKVLDRKRTGSSTTRGSSGSRSPGSSKGYSNSSSRSSSSTTIHYSELVNYQMRCSKCDHPWEYIVWT